MPRIDRRRLGHLALFLALWLVPRAECQSSDEMDHQYARSLDKSSFTSNLFLRGWRAICGPTAPQPSNTSQPMAPMAQPNDIAPLDSQRVSYYRLPDRFGPKSDAPRLRGGLSKGDQAETTQASLTTNNEAMEHRRHLEDPNITEGTSSLEPQDNLDTALKRDEQGDDSGVNWEKKYIGASLKNWLIGAACVFVVLASMCNIFTFCSFVWHCGRLSDNSKQGDSSHVEKEKSQFDVNDGCSSTSPSSPEADEPTTNI